MLDSLPNLSQEEAAERLEPFVRTVRAAHAKTPVVLVENETYADSPLRQERLAKVVAVNSLLKKLYERMRAGGETTVYYVPASSLLGSAWRRHRRRHAPGRPWFLEDSGRNGPGPVSGAAREQDSSK